MFIFLFLVNVVSANELDNLKIDNELNKINVLVISGKYSKAKKKILKLQPLISDDDKSKLLEKQLNLCDKKIAEINFWKRYNIRYDKFENKTFYKSRWDYNDPLIITLIDDGKTILISLKFTVSLHEWMFLDTVIINYNNSNLKFPNLQRCSEIVSCSQYSCTLKEWAYFIMDNKQIGEFREIINSYNPSMKFSGSGGYLVINLNGNNIQHIGQMIELYDYLIESRKKK